ncbi:MAG: carph-isopro domain-containing protein [Alphaproteobacteria bacterium]
MTDIGDEASASGPSSGETEPDVPAQPVIDAFGGIRPMAAKLGVPVSTVQGWKQRDTIPASRMPSIEAAAHRHAVAMPHASGAASDPPYRPAGPRPGIRFSPPDEDVPPARVPTSEGQPVTSETPPAAPSPRQADAGPPASDGRRAGGALALAGIALAVAVLWPVLFGIWFGADAQEGDAAALAARVSALEEAGEGEALQAAVAALRSDLDALAAGDPADVQALAERIDALEQSAGNAGATPPALAEALDSLERAIATLDGVVSGLQTRIDAIEAEVGRIEGAADGESVGALQAALEQVQATLDQVQGDLGQVTEVAEAARQQAVEEATALVEREVARLGDSIAALAGADGASADNQAFLIALGQLSARLRTAQPFADEVAALDQVVAGSEALAPSLGPAVEEAFAPLADAAAQGVPTLAGLRAAFDDTRRVVLNAADTPPEDTLDEIWGEIRGMVTVSRVDGAGTGTVDGILAAAERNLVAGDLAGAVSELEKLAALGGGYAEAAAPWIADARLRLAADAAVEAVQQAAMARFRPELPAADAAAPGQPEAGDDGQ